MKTIEQTIERLQSTIEIAKENGDNDLVEMDTQIVWWLQDLIKKRDENKELVGKCAILADAVYEARKNAAYITKASNEKLGRANSILDGVKAMIQAQDGATHRQRNFYAAAIVRMIDNLKSFICPLENPEGDLPF